MSDDDSILPTELDSGSDGDSVCAAASSTAVQAEHTANTAQVPSSIPGTTLDDHVEHDDDPYGFLEREREMRRNDQNEAEPRPEAKLSLRDLRLFSDLLARPLLLAVLAIQTHMLTVCFTSACSKQST